MTFLAGLDDLDLAGLQSGLSHDDFADPGGVGVGQAVLAGRNDHAMPLSLRKATQSP